MATDSANPVAAAEHAVGLVPEGGVIGLGSGRAATAFVHALARRIRDGLHIRAVATSQTTSDLAMRMGIPLTTFDAIDAIDVDFDGADEVDPHLNLIKGLGGALVREKIVAAASRRLVILVGGEKMVPALGSHGILPVEVVPFGLSVCSRRLAALGYPPEPRRTKGQLFVSDNGNHILDCRVSAIDRPEEVEQAIRAIPGVVDTGLFVRMAHTVVIGDGNNVHVRHRSELP
jgi:ribose 5-phosphate isomerase A